MSKNLKKIQLLHKNSKHRDAGRGSRRDILDENDSDNISMLVDFVEKTMGDDTVEAEAIIREINSDEGNSSRHTVNAVNHRRKYTKRSTRINRHHIPRKKRNVTKTQFTKRQWASIYAKSAKLRGIINSNDYIYIDERLFLNHPEVVKKSRNGFRLTRAASRNPDAYCIKVLATYTFVSSVERSGAYDRRGITISDIELGNRLEESKRQIIGVYRANTNIC